MDEKTLLRIVAEFYTAVATRDADELGALIDKVFAEDAVLVLPPSLPYGGRIAGAKRLRRMFTGAAASSVQAGPVGLRIAALTAGADRVVAELVFDWYAPGSDDPLPTGAVEVWTFSGGQVRAIDAYYRDTAACVERVARAGTAG
jgi:ketosteroid isomerase-like protein